MSAAAFFDVDGTLVGVDIVRVSLYLARRAAGLEGRVGWLARIAAGVPRLAAAEFSGDRQRTNELHYASYRGVSEDRLRHLADGLFDELVRPALFPGARELVERHRDAGRRPVLLTGALDLVAEPLARTLGVEDVGANALVFRGGVATGELRRPVVAGAGKAVWVRRYAAQHGIDLERSSAFANDVADLPLLSAVGRPAAVNPTPALTRIARASRWPIIQLRAERAAGKRSAPRGEAERSPQAGSRATLRGSKEGSHARPA